MANSLELRSPFLSFELFKYMSEIDPKYRFNAFEKKKFLKNAANHLLPKNIINQKKRGFNSPVSYWFTNVFFEIFNDLLKSDKAKNMLNVSYVEKLLLKNKNRGIDNGNVLFNLFCLLIWINNNKYSL